MATARDAATSTVRVDVLGEVAVTDGSATVAGAGLGGRRARVLLVALALSNRPVPAESLAEIIWAGDAPATWPVALRGVVSGLRAALAPTGHDGAQLIRTTPAGYCLADGVAVDVDQAVTALARAEQLMTQARYDAVLDLCTPVSGHRGDLLLPDEDAGWLEPHRRSVDANAVHALQLIAASHGATGLHHRAVEAAREAVERMPLDEPSHRALIRAHELAGDRAGVVQAYERCRALLAEELGIDPSKETVDAYLAALSDQPSNRVARVPTFSSTFVGRESELAALAEAITMPGLVTVTGPGGVGKSRLTAETAGVRGDFAGGRSWVALSPLVESALVDATIALGLGVPPGAEGAVEAIAEYLAPLGRALLVLDGCERVIDGVASLAQSLRADCPQLTIVVTTRAALDIDDERVVAVGPLPLPPMTSDGLAWTDPTLELLQDRVRGGGGELDVHPSDEVARELLAELCRRCGGLPLAIELAAAQLTAVPVGDLLDTLPAAAAWRDPLRALARSSVAMLDPDEEAVFRRFAVLDGPVGLQLVRAVVSTGPLAPERVIRILRELAARGLVSVDRSGPRWRYQQDDDLHQLARELLVEAGEERAVLTRLAGAIEAMLPDDPRSPPAPYTAAVNGVLGSVRGVLAAALEGRMEPNLALRLAFRLHRYWAATNVAEGRFWLSRLLAVAPSDGESALATYALGYLSYWAGDTGDAVARLQDAVDALRGREDGYAARALIYLAGLADDQDRVEAAVEHVREAVAAAAPFDTDLQVAAAIGLGCVLAERADPAAVESAGAAMQLCRERGSLEQLTAALPTAAMVCWQVGDLAGAHRYIDEAWPLHQQTRRIARVVLLSAAAGVALADGDVAAAVDFATRGDDEATELGVEREVPLVRSLRALSLIAAGQVVDAAVHAAAAVEAARALDFEYPLALSLEVVALVCLAGAGLGVGTGAGAELDRVALTQLLGSAAEIRRRGDRPGPPTIRPSVDAAILALGGEQVIRAERALLPRDAADLALTLVGAVSRGH
jgi:predicted ATPase/DNA-binding SARP family transcriptional activator